MASKCASTNKLSDRGSSIKKTMLGVKAGRGIFNSIRPNNMIKLPFVNPFEKVSLEEFFLREREPNAHLLPVQTQLAPEKLPPAPKLLTDAEKAHLASLVASNKILSRLTCKQYRLLARLFRTKQNEIPRHLRPADRTEIPDEPFVRHLTVPLRKSGGRCSITGRIVCRHRGGGLKRRIRLVDTNRTSSSPQRVVRIEFDPNRSSKLALVQDLETKELSYIVPPEAMDHGAIIPNDGSITPGNMVPLHAIPIGTLVYGLELKPGTGTTLVRSAGTYARVLGGSADISEMTAEEIDALRDTVSVKLPSGKIKEFPRDCRAVVGVVGNGLWKDRVLGKAGASRRNGIRPSVRGTAMNPVDHPMGGGTGGKNKGHLARNPWGKICK